MAPKDYDRDDRPSWREIDSKRDRSSHREEKRDEPKMAGWAKQQLVKQAEQLFEKKMTPEAETLHKEVRKAHGTKTFDKLASEYLEKFGLPDDWRTLLLFLDHGNEEVFRQVILKMRDELPNQNMTDKRSFKTKLSILSNAASNPKIARMADQMKKQLS